MEVLFICKYNAGRSRMAEAAFNELSKKNRAISRGIGSNPHAHSVLRAIPNTIKVMEEIGVKARPGIGKGVTRNDAEKADIIVVLIDKKQWHILPKYISNSSKTRYFSIPDSNLRSKNFLDQHRRNREITYNIAKRLVKEIG